MEAWKASRFKSHTGLKEPNGSKSIWRNNITSMTCDKMPQAFVEKYTKAASQDIEESSESWNDLAGLSLFARRMDRNRFFNISS
jgi:hypothetical protein